MTKSVGVHEAKTRLSRLLDEVLAVGRVLIGTRTHATSHGLDDGKYRLEWMQVGWIVPSNWPA